MATSSIIVLKSLDLFAPSAIEHESRGLLVLHAQCLLRPHMNDITSNTKLTLIGRDKILSQNHSLYARSPDPSFLGLGGVACEINMMPSH